MKDDFKFFVRQKAAKIPNRTHFMRDESENRCEPLEFARDIATDLGKDLLDLGVELNDGRDAIEMV